jgi:hypothetical protein
MTPFRVSVFAVVASIVLLFVVLELIRTRRLQERYALLWLLTGTVGISYPPSALFVLGSLFILVVLLHYSTVISRLSDQNTVLAQKLALLESRFDDESSKVEGD